MNIREYLARVDETEVAKALGVSVHVVRKWRQGARVPRRRNALALIEWSHGVLSLRDVYAPDELKAA